MLLIAFVAIERRVREPMLPLKLFRNPSFTGAQIAAAAISATFFAIFLYITLYLQVVLGLSAIEAGLAYLPATVIIFFVSGATASLGEKVSPRIMIAGGLALVAAGMALMTMAERGLELDGDPARRDPRRHRLRPVQPGADRGRPRARPRSSRAGWPPASNDTFRQAGIAVGVAALGALIPAEAMLGGGSPLAFVDGLHDALWVSAVVRRRGRDRRGRADPLGYRAPPSPASSRPKPRSAPSPSGLIPPRSVMPGAAAVRPRPARRAERDLGDRLISARRDGR